MNFWLIIFHYDQWYDIYVKNCTMKKPEEWYNLPGGQNVPLGLLYVTLGLLLWLMYIPFLIVMLRPEFIKYSCYKLMVLIGVIDLFSVFVDGVVAGIQSIFGAHFCTNPTFFWMTTNIISFAWYAVTFTCVILAIDRFLELCWTKGADFVFGHCRIYFWMILPLVYTSFISSPFIYNTILGTYYTDPFFGTNLGGNTIFHPPIYHFLHNITIPTIMAVIYLALVIFLKIRSIVYPNVGISKMQKIMTLQALAINVEMFIACILYVLNELIPMPPFTNIVAHVFKIMVHGDTPLVYLLLNASLRRAVFELVTNSAQKVRHMTTNGRNSRVSHMMSFGTNPTSTQ